MQRYCESQLAELIQKPANNSEPEFLPPIHKITKHFTICSNRVQSSKQQPISAPRKPQMNSNVLPHIQHRFQPGKLYAVPQSARAAKPPTIQQKQQIPEQQFTLISTNSANLSDLYTPKPITAQQSAIELPYGEIEPFSDLSEPSDPEQTFADLLSDLQEKKTTLNNTFNQFTNPEAFEQVPLHVFFLQVNEYEPSTSFETNLLNLIKQTNELRCSIQYLNNSQDDPFSRAYLTEVEKFEGMVGNCKYKISNQKQLEQLKDVIEQYRHQIVVTVQKPPETLEEYIIRLTLLSQNEITQLCEYLELMQAIDRHDIVQLIETSTQMEQRLQEGLQQIKTFEEGKMLIQQMTKERTHIKQVIAWVIEAYEEQHKQ
ncbi:Hypothetical_protein [Hexamita inflata]|uniref:Hypothetical_protein n=1 Tax=Hexamita inflata TaxID=28002 RepID=A0AA86UWY5_9EUKA|nr:Hypothetical protein HINF_LOCUS55682 [Hexamita inflata]